MDLYRDALRFPGGLQGRTKLLTRNQIIDAGLTPGELGWHASKGRLLRVQRGMYGVGAEPDLLDRARAALAVCPDGAALGFHTAAALLGFGVPESDDLHVVVPMGSLIPHRKGLRVHESAVAFDAVICLGVRCTPAARTAIDLVRSLDRPTGLAVLDAARFAQACSQADLESELVRHTGLRGICQARDLVALADGRAECKQETHLRLILHDGGLRGFEPQVQVWVNESEFPFRLDVANPALRVAAEYDGQSHTRDRLRSDRRRHNRLSDLGWILRYFTDFDLYRTPDLIVATMLQAIQGR